MNQIIDYKPRQQKRKSKPTLHAETQKTIKALIITLSIMIIALSSVFLFSTSRNSQKGYVLQQEKLKNEDLKTENSLITSKINKSTSVSKLEINENLIDMQKMEEKTYVTAEDNKIK